MQVRQVVLDIQVRQLPSHLGKTQDLTIVYKAVYDLVPAFSLLISYPLLPLLSSLQLSGPLGVPQTLHAFRPRDLCMHSTLCLKYSLETHKACAPYSFWVSERLSLTTSLQKAPPPPLFILLYFSSCHFSPPGIFIYFLPPPIKIKVP